MAKPDTQTRPGHTAGTKDQSPQPDRKAPGRPEEIRPSAPGIAAAGDPAVGSDKAETDAAAWGLGGASGGLSKETKIGLALIAVLLCAFTFVVYKRIDQSRQHQTSAASDTAAGAAESDSPEARVPSAAEPKPTQSAPAATDPFGEVVPVQHEPSYAHEEVAPEPVATETAAMTVDSSVSPTLAFDSEPVEHGEPLLSPDNTDAGGDPFHVADAAPTFPAQTEPSSSDPFAPQQQDRTPHTATEDAESAGLLELFPSDADSAEANPSPQSEPNFEQSAIAVLPESKAEPAAASEQNAEDQPFGDPFTLSDQAEPQMPAVSEVEPDASVSVEQVPAQDEPTEPPLLLDGHPAEFMPPADPATPDETPVIALEPPLLSPEQQTVESRPATSGSERDMAGSTTVIHAPGTAEAEAQPAQYAELGTPAFEEPVVSPAADSGMPAEQTTPETSVDPFEALGPAPLEVESGTVPEISVGTSPPTDSPTLYEVRPGDSFWMISRRHYGTARYYVALARYNAERVPDPRRMRPGMQVLLPAREVLESRYPDLFPRRTTGRPAYEGARSDLSPGFHLDGTGQPVYRVGSNDTLGAIAQRYLGRSSRWLQIYELNRSALPDPHALKVGTILKLPADASHVRTASHTR